MNIRKIHRSFITSRVPMIIAVLIFIALRIPWIDDGEALELAASTLIQIGTALFLLHFTQKYTIIQQRTLLPAFFYLLLVGTNSLFFYDLRGSIAAFLILFCLWILFDTYQNPLSQRSVLNISLVLTLGSFYWPPLLWFFPLLWHGMYQLKSLNIRTFFASLMGLAVVGLFLFAWSVYKNDWLVFIQIVPDFRALWDFRIPSLASIKETVTNIFLVIMFTLAVFNIFIVGVAEKAQARTFLGYLSVLTVAVSILFLGQNQWEKEWLLILYVPLSIVLAHYFTLSQRLSTVWLFLLTVLFFLAKIFLSSFIQ